MKSSVTGIPSNGKHYRACNLCEAICGIELHIVDGVIRAIRGDAADPFSRGHVCAKAVALKDLHEDPDRLKQPMRKTAAGFEPVSWDEAFDAAAAGLDAVRRRHGRDAVAIYAGNPVVHNHGAMLFNPLLYRALGTRRRYSATSVDQLPHQLAAYFLYGHQLLLPVPDIDRTAFFLLLGSNPVVSNGSLMTAPDFSTRIKAMQDRGGRMVVVDPRRSETAAVADRHFFIRPGSDALLLAAMLQTIFADALASPGPLQAFTSGLDEVAAHVAPFTPDRVAVATGIAADEIRTLARDFCAAPSAVAHGRMGLSVQEYGGLCQWMINVLNIVTGNLDRVGGAMFTRPAVDIVSETGRGSFGRFHSLVRALPEFAGELPVATMAEDMLCDAPDRARALLTIAGNPVLSTPNGTRLDQALERLEFVVAIDFYLNETTRHADIILPPTAALEHDHYDLVFNALAVRNTARYSPALFPVTADGRHDWEIALALAGRLETGSLRRRLRARLVRFVMRRLGPSGIVARLWKKGPYARGLAFRDLAASQHGHDLGALEPCLPARLRTADSRIRLAPPELTCDLARLEKSLAGERAGANGTLVLISRRQPRSNNSWMHNFRRLVKGKPQCTLLMHPDDAAHRGLRDGDSATIRSRVGEIDAPVQIDAALMRGVVCLPHGWGHGRDGIALATAQRHAGVSINDVTDHQRVDQLSGNAALSGVPVDVCAARA